MTHKISGILNNCSLNFVLNPLLKRIDDYAMQEMKGDCDLNSEPYFADYRLMRNLFAQHHGFDEDDFSWGNFSDLLHGYRLNFFHLQLLFAPILRQFIFVKNNYQEHKDSIDIANLQVDGRYATLDFRMADELIYQPLGLKANLTLVDSDGVLISSDSAGETTLDSALDELHIFQIHEKDSLKTHFEATSDQSALNIMTKTELHERGVLDITGFDVSNLGQDIDRTQQALDVIKQQVAETHAALPVITPQETDILNQIESCSKDFSGHARSLLSQHRQGLFHVDMADQIKTDAIDAAEAKPGESDEKFAKRLQEAEISRYIPRR